MKETSRHSPATLTRPANYRRPRHPAVDNLLDANMQQPEPSIRRGVLSALALLLFAAAFSALADILVGAIVDRQATLPLIDHGTSRQIVSLGFVVDSLRLLLRCFPILLALAVFAGGWLLHRPLLQRVAILQEQLLAANRFDPLTGCLNRRAFAQEAARVFAYARRYDSPVAVLMIDIDHFKQVNDLCGHTTGDLVLCALAGVLLRNIREIDILARMGGEEFTILLPESGLVAAMLVAQRVRRLIAAELIDSASLSDPISITVSIGVAAMHSTDADLFDAIDRADRALSRAKQNGRDCVECEVSALALSHFNATVRNEAATPAPHKDSAAKL